MKKIYSAATLLCLILSGCVRENVHDSAADAAPAEELVPVRIATLAPSALAETRTMLNPGNSVFWNSDDAVACVSFDEPAKLTNAFSDGPVAVFEGHVQNGFLQDNLPVLVYPYREAQDGAGLPKKRMTSVIEGTYVIENLVIPQKQELLSGTFDPAANLSAAVVGWNDETPVQFRNLCMLMRLSLKGTATVKRIRISCSKPIVGTYLLECQGNAANSADGFKLSLQGELNGNPARSSTAVLESEDGIRLTEEPQDFYLAAFVQNAGSNMNANVFVTTADGEVFQLGGSNFSVWYENVRPGHIASLGEYTVNGPLFDHGPDFTCDRKEREIQVSKTEYLKGDYEVIADPSAAWLSASKTAEGLRISVGENSTGNARTGSIAVMRGDETLTTLNVTQHKFGYRDLLGRYLLRNYNSSTTTGSWVLYFKEAEDGREDHYVVEIAKFMNLTPENYRPTFIINYNAVGRTPLSIPLPQTLQDYNGGKAELFMATQNKELCVGDGNGFDLVWPGEGYVDGFSFSANAFSTGLYHVINSLYVNIDDFGEEYIQILDGKRPTLIPITDNLGNGGHQGITPVN